MSKLREQMIKQMTLRNFAPKTKEAYIAAVKGIAQYYNKRPDEITQEEVEEYILHMLKERKVSWSTCNVAIAGLKFFYDKTIKNPDIKITFPPRKKVTKLPLILTMEEVWQIIGSTTNLKHRVLLMTTYSAGLRVSEVVGLKINDIESKRMLIRVEQAKGNKDRYTILSEILLKELREYWKLYKPRTWLFPSKEALQAPNLALSFKSFSYKNEHIVSPEDLQQGQKEIRHHQS